MPVTHVDDLIQVSERRASIYEAAGVLMKYDEPPMKGREPEALEWGPESKIWRRLYVPQWAAMIVGSLDLNTDPKRHEGVMIRALTRAREDKEARTRFVMMFRLCGDTAADRRRCVEEFLL